MSNTEVIPAVRELFIEELGRIVGGSYPADGGGDGSTSGLGEAPPQRKDEPKKFTSLAIGEEGGGPPTFTTLAVGEEGGDGKVTFQPL